MVTIIPVGNLSMDDLIYKFKLRRVADEQFFTEWLTDLPEIADFEKQILDRVKSNYFSLIEHPPMSESIVKMVVLAPLLDLAGFYQLPFRVKGESSVEVIFEEQGEVIRGQIDVLVLQNQMWILVIESKRTRFSLEVGLPQALTYMLGNPDSEKPSFGMVTNGSNFNFLKLTKHGTPQYALSDEFSLLNRRNDLYTVLSILKRLGNLLLE